MWVATTVADHIFYAPGASALHQQNIILHEIGHMLCEHAIENVDANFATLLSDLDPEMIRRVLLRSRYSTLQEVEAELTAALILEKAGWSVAKARPEGTLGNLHDVFGTSQRR